MRLQKLVLHNYGAFYGRHEFCLESRGLLLVLGQNHDDPRADSNGSGKSTLFDALDWVVYGEVPRGDHVDSVINEEAGGDTWVELDLVDDDGRAVNIFRYRKVQNVGTGLRLTVDGEDQTALDADETQRYINWHLGMDRDVFHATVLFGQADMFRFADAKDADRLEILTKVLQLGEIDAWAERTRELRREAVEHRTSLEVEVGRLQGGIEGVQKVDYSERIQAWENARTERARGIEATLVKMRAREAELLDMLQKEPAAQERLAQLQAFSPQLPEIAQAEKDLAEADATRASVLTSIAQYQAFLSQAKAKLQRFQTLGGGGSCSECDQQVTVAYAQWAQQYLSGHIYGLQDTLQGLQQTKAQWDAYAQRIQARLQELRHTLQEAEKQHAVQVSLAQTALHQIRALHGTLQEQRVAITDRVRELDQLLAQANPFVEEKKALQGKLAELEKALAARQADLEQARHRERCLEFWNQAWGPKGLKSYILDTRLQELTDAANHWVHLLTGGSIWVKFETQVVGRTGGVRNKFNIRVFRYDRSGAVVERNYRSWSGGEKQRVSLGIDFGLAQLIATRSQKTYDLLILDEVFRHLDRSGREAVMEMLQRVSATKSSVIVVDHDADFKGLFENLVVVAKKDGRAAILEGSDVRGEEEPEAAQAGRDLPVGGDVPESGRKARGRRAGVHRRNARKQVDRQRA